MDPAVITEAESRGLNVIDATCPFVSAAHTCAADLAASGYAVVIVGESDHPEVEGILAHAGGEALIVQHASDIPAKLPGRRIGVVVQTTQPPALLQEVVAALLPRVIGAQGLQHDLQRHREAAGVRGRVWPRRST